MIERIVPRQRPDDDTLGAPEPAHEGLEYSEAIRENVAEHIALRIAFASAVAKAKGETLESALFSYTDLYNQLDFGNARTASETREIHPDWKTFVKDLEAIGDDKAKSLELVTDRYLKALGTESKLQGEWHAHYPFGYYLRKNGNVVHLMFGRTTFIPKSNTEEPGALQGSNFEVQKQKLKTMFEEIKHDYPHVKEVEGASWLYNLEGYRRLFPPEYTESRQLSYDHYLGDSRWGQFINKDGYVNKERASKFLENLEHLNPNNLEAAFPMPRYEVRTDIDNFYRFYGIEHGNSKASSLDDYAPSPEQAERASVLKRLVLNLERNNVRYTVAGGYGLDGMYGRLTRDHEDIDILSVPQDAETVRKVIRAAGFVLELVKIRSDVEVYNHERTNTKLEFNAVDTSHHFRDLQAEELFPIAPNASLDGIQFRTPTLKAVAEIDRIQTARATEGQWGEYAHTEWKENIKLAITRKMEKHA